MARIADCIFVDSVSFSLGKFFPRNSDIYLSTFGTRQTSRSGRGCSLKRASLSSLDRQRFTCFERYDAIGLGTENVPSLCFTSSAGSNSSPTSNSWSDSDDVDDTVATFCHFSLLWVARCSPLLRVLLEGVLLEEELFVFPSVIISRGVKLVSDSSHRGSGIPVR